MSHRKRRRRRRGVFNQLAPASHGCDSSSDSNNGSTSGTSATQTTT
jgi:hypothetical protein